MVMVHLFYHKNNDVVYLNHNYINEFLYEVKTKMYSVERFEKEICISEYMDKYVNVEEFLEYCKECPNYGRLWSCPPYDFDPLEIWEKYETLYVTVRKIIFDEDKAPEDKDAMMSVLSEVKDHMSQELFEMERKFPGSISLSAGSCGLCRKAGCTRVCGRTVPLSG